MKYQYGVTDNGTVWVRQFTNNNRLLAKRVLKKHIQYDTAFNPKGEAVHALITDQVNGNQFAKIYKIEKTWFQKLLDKIFNRPQIDVKKLPELDMDVLRTQGQYSNFVANLYEMSTSHKNTNVDEIVSRLKEEYLRQVFR